MKLYFYKLKLVLRICVLQNFFFQTPRIDWWAPLKFLLATAEILSLPFFWLPIRIWQCTGALLICAYTNDVERLERGVRVLENRK